MKKSAQSAEKIILVKINQVVGFLYLPNQESSSAIIFAQGGPAMGDRGLSELWPIVKKHNWILFVPDYLGYCRSEGVFNLVSNIDTIYQSEQFLRGKIPAIDTLTGKKMRLKCKDLLLVGASWGGAIVPFLNKFSPSSIKNILLIHPISDWVSQGKTRYLEETTAETDQYIRRAWSNIYRGYEKSEWPDIFKGKSKQFNPLDNLEYLKGKSVFIAHGGEDKIVNWRKSFKYFKKLKEAFPNQKIYWKLAKGDHSTKFCAKMLNLVLPEVADSQA